MANDMDEGVLITVFRMILGRLLRCHSCKTINRGGRRVRKDAVWDRGEGGHCFFTCLPLMDLVDGAACSCSI